MSHREGCWCDACTIAELRRELAEAKAAFNTLDELKSRVDTRLGQVERELAEARGLLNSAVFWVRPHNRELARVIDAFLTAADQPLTSAPAKATGWARTGGNAPAGVELRDDGTLYVPPDTPPGTYTVEYTEGTYTDQPKLGV